MKKLLGKLIFKQGCGISEFAVWTLLCGLSCITAVFITAQLIFSESMYISGAMISLGLRMIALTVLISAVADFLVSGMSDE